MARVMDLVRDINLARVRVASEVVCVARSSWRM